MTPKDLRAPRTEIRAAAFCGVSDVTEFACPAPAGVSPPPERPKADVTSRSPTDCPQVGEAGGEA